MTLALPHSTAMNSRRSNTLLEVEEFLAGIVTDAWARGWQPHELIRQARRKATKRGVILARQVIWTDHLTRPSNAYHEHWVEQIDSLTGSINHRSANRSPGWLERLGLDGSPIEFAEISSLVEAWSRLGLLPCLLPPPQGIAIESELELAPGVAPSPVLDKVRALLAKAEATTFAAEAETFTAKAHELMARHTIDEAMLARATRGQRAPGAPITVRLAIDDPYAKAKSALAQWVAETNGCHACFHPSASMSSVVGHATDVAAVEMLYTSMLVQAQTAMNAEAAGPQASKHRRSRGFRSAFLEAYAARIGERLREVNAQVKEEALAQDSEGRLLPELARRESAVGEHFAELFPHLTTSARRGAVDAAGFAAGHDAANRAALGLQAMPGEPGSKRGELG